MSGEELNELNELSLEDKMTVVQFLIADLAANMLSDNPAITSKARHDVGALAMTFSNLHQLIMSAKPDDLAVVKSIYRTYRYQPVEDEVQT